MQKINDIPVTFYVSETGEVLHKRKVKGYKSYNKLVFPFGSSLYICIKDNKVENICYDLEGVDIKDYDIIKHYVIGVEPILMSKVNMEDKYIRFYNSIKYSYEIYNRYKKLFSKKINDNECSYYASDNYDEDLKEFKSIDEFRLQISYVLSSNNLTVGVANNNKEICKICSSEGENPYLTLYESAYTSEKVRMFTDMFNNMY